MGAGTLGGNAPPHRKPARPHPVGRFGRGCDHAVRLDCHARRSHHKSPARHASLGKMGDKFTKITVQPTPVFPRTRKAPAASRGASEVLRWGGVNRKSEVIAGAAATASICVHFHAVERKRFDRWLEPGVGMLMELKQKRQCQTFTNVCMRFARRPKPARPDTGEATNPSPRGADQTPPRHSGLRSDSGKLRSDPGQAAG